MTLELGGVEESIVVTGETPLLQAGSASIGSAIDKAESGRTSGRLDVFCTKR